MGKIYVLCNDYGCEGLAEPFIAFRTEAQARGAEDLVKRITQTVMIRVVEAAFYDEGETLSAPTHSDKGGE